MHSIVVLLFMYVLCTTSFQYTGFSRHAVRLTRLSVQLPDSSTTSSSDFVKQQLKAAEDKFLAERAAKAKASAASGEQADIPLLDDLEMISYLEDGTGMLTSIIVEKGVKASVYAIYDSTSSLRFVGVSRNINQSLRMHLARQPSLTYSFKYHHISKPSRTLLESIRDSWIQNNSGEVDGNDNGENQNLWEAALDVKPLMTEEDKAALAAGKEASKIKEESAMKRIARRYEDEKVAILTERGCKESMRFCPKLKTGGLLDLWTQKTKDEVPKGPPKGKK